MYLKASNKHRVFIYFFFFWKKRMICYLHSIQICPIKSMALDAGKTIIVEFAASKKKKKSVFWVTSIPEYLTSYVSFFLATAHLWMG